jgi:hypothetical protein
MNNVEKIIDTLCIWGITVNILVFTFAVFQGMASLQVLSLANISLLLVNFIVKK